RSQLEGPGLPIVDALCLADLAKTKGEARRTIQQGGAYVNNRRVTDQEARLTAENLVGDRTIVLRVGKKRYGLLRFEG
ncbi:MAG: S4 domain-containing protein, partial [Thermogutta sp.]